MDNPVRRRWRPREVLPLMSARRRGLVSGLGSLGVILLAFTMIFAVNAADTPAFARDATLTMTVLTVLAMATLLTLGAAGALVLRTGRALVDSQLAYYTLGDVAAPTGEQLQALSLVAFACYPFGHWTETLEVLPVERRVRHVPDPAGTLAPLPLQSITSCREDLDESWNVLSPESCHRMIDALFAGLHTAQFAAQWELNDQAGREAFRDRLTGLTGLTVADLDACFIRSTGRPPYLIWGWDLWRVIQLARIAYGADLLGEQEAWQVILRASDLVHALYPDHASYHTSVRLGHAMWADSLEAVNERTRMFEVTERNEHHWPINAVPWTPTTVEFSPSMADGFAMEIELLRDTDTDEPNPIG